ncbi:hypothetical protein Tco_0680835 [Tanacetum coccineum]|uniref:Uncharacterized protein n=1 Tax=Tanacetum coccineum TaxID=301880 RepID=A0ABQ4XN22_9ASTR
MLGRGHRCRLLLESMHQKGEEYGGSSSNVGATGDSTSKANDTLSIQLSDDPPPVTASKVGEFIHGISTTTPKRLFVQSNKYLAFRKPLSKKGQLVIGPPMFAMGESVVGSSHKATDDLCSSGAGSNLRGQVDREAKVKAEFAQMLDTQQRMFDERVAALDARLDKMVKETDEESAPMLRDARETKKFIIENGFHYFLNKFRESEMLGTRLGACISANILDGMRQCLEAGFVHGKKGTDINSIPAPNAAEVYADAMNALNDVPFPLLEQIEACAKQPFSYLEALLVMGPIYISRFILNTPYPKTLKNSRPLPDYEEYVVSTSADTPYEILWSTITRSTFYSQYAWEKKEEEESSEDDWNNACRETARNVISILSSLSSYDVDTAYLTPWIQRIDQPGLHKSIHDEAGTLTNPASGSNSFTSGVTELFIIALSIPYARGAGATVKDIIPVDEVITVKSDDVLAGTASNPAASDVPTSDPSTLSALLSDGLIVRSSLLTGLVFAYSPFKSILGLLIPTLGFATA